MEPNKRPLMGTDNILELQDNGYKSTVSALSEIIDNSIQANAKEIEIVIVKNSAKDGSEIEEILIIDNGDGMDGNVFQKALQMSSGNRAKAKSGLGKYGQGLPNSSISQTKRVEVYTRQNSQTLFNYIDLEEIYNSGEPFLPNIEQVENIQIPLFKLGHLDLVNSGTIVRWIKPNRVKPRTVKTLIDHLEQFVGRVFRYFINGYKDRDGVEYKCKIGVKVFDYNGVNFALNTMGRKEIKPFDPLFLMKKTQMNELFKESKHPTSELYKEKIVKEFTVNYNGEDVKTEVEIKLSYCRKSERDLHGRNAGQTPFGKKYLYRNLHGTSGYNNISIVRAGREIDCGSFGFIADVSAPVNRWWSAEINVEPVIDSIIGIDNKKQQASSIKFLENSDYADDDNHEILKWISTILNENIKQVKKIIEGEDAKPIVCPGPGDGPHYPPGGGSEGADPAPGEIPQPGSPEDEKIRKELFEWIKQRYPELSNTEIREIVDYAFKIKDNHIFIKSDLGDTKLYSYKVFGTKVLIEINYNHSFYKHFIKKFEGNPDDELSLRSIRLLISSLVNSEIINSTNEQVLISDRRKLNNRMFESLEDYINRLYN